MGRLVRVQHSASRTHVPGASICADLADVGGRVMTRIVHQRTPGRPRKRSTLLLGEPPPLRPAWLRWSRISPLLSPTRGLQMRRPRYACERGRLKLASQLCRCACLSSSSS